MLCPRAPIHLRQIQATRPSYISERIIEVLFSRRNQHRAIVTQDSQGFFRVHRDRWWIGDWEIGKAFWVQDDHHATITDSAENARKLLKKHFAQHQNGFGMPDI
jgi:hypothetical protein